MKLRDYQEQGIRDLRKKFAEGQKKVVLCSATGSGKTLIFTELAKRTLQANMFHRVLILTDRIELLKQAGGGLKLTGLQCEFITADRSKIKWSHRAYVGMIETVWNRIKRDTKFLTNMGHITLLIIDEAHMGNFRKILPHFPNSYVVGATATPVSSSKKHPMKDDWDDIIQASRIEELVEQGWLAPYKHYGVKMDLSGVAMDYKRGDYSESSMYQFYNKGALYKGVVDNYVKFARGRKTLVFNCNIAHARNMCDMFRSAGVRADNIDSETHWQQRERILKEYNEGMIDVITNCSVLTKGYDEPSISAIIVNRATKSKALFFQMLGRGSRPYPGKDNWIVIDHGNNYIEHGFWYDEPDWVELFHKPPKPGKGEGVAPIKQCEICEMLVAVATKVCPQCGYLFPVEQRKLKEGEFAELNMQAKKLPEHLEGVRYRDMNISDLLMVREVKGYKMGWVLNQIKIRPDPIGGLQELADIKGYKPYWVKLKLKHWRLSHVT